MDYIQEELRRQREALAAVLLGGGSRQAPEDSREAGHFPAGPLSAVHPAAAERTAAGTALNSAGTRRSRLPAEGGIAGAGSAPPAFDGGSVKDRTVRSGTEITATAGERGGADAAALRERGPMAPSPTPTEALRDRWTAAEAEAPGGGRTAAEAEAPGGGRTAAEAEASGGGRTAAEAEASGDRWTAAESSPLGERRSRSAPAAERTVTELVYPAGGGAAVTAESLSRAFQRDARRYDGGFSPY